MLTTVRNRIRGHYLSMDSSRMACRFLMRCFAILLVASGCSTLSTRTSVDAPSHAAAAPLTAAQPAGHMFKGEPTSTLWTDVLLIENDAYTVGFSPTTRTPVWVAYSLFGTDAESQVRPTSHFSDDPRTGLSDLTHASYTNSGYDRGHMAPSSGIGRCFGEDAQLETFIVSNICPQHPGCNQRTWERLENHVAIDYADRFGVVWVVDGPIFDGPCEELLSDVRIPARFYKIIVAEIDGQPEALAVVMPNQRTERSRISVYVTSVDRIEEQTGLDFFHKLSDEREAALEANETPHTRWGIDFELRPEFPGADREIRKRPCD